MIKIIFFVVFGTIIGFTFLANIMNATNIGFQTIRSWLDSTNAFYKLIANLFIISTHPIFQIFLAFGIILMGIRVIFVR